MVISIEQRLSNLEQALNALSKKVDNLSSYDFADKASIRQTEGVHGEAIEDNSTDLEDVRTGLEEVYEMILGEE